MTCISHKAVGTSKIRIMDITLWCVAKVFRCFPAESIAYVLLNVSYSFTWMLQTLSLQYFFDTIELAGEKSIGTLFLSLIVMGLCYLAYHVLDGISNCYSEIIVIKINHRMNQILSEQTVSLNLAAFEDAGFLEKIEKAKGGAERVSSFFLTVMDTATYYIPYFLFMAAYFFGKNPKLVGIIAAAFVPALLSRFAASYSYKKLEDEDARLRRKNACYERCLTEKDCMRDTRILGASCYFEELYSENLKKQYLIRKRITFHDNMKQLLLQIAAACGYGIIIWILFLSTIGGEITVGTFTAVIATVSNLFRFMNKMVVERVGAASQQIGSIGNFVEFQRQNEVEIPKVRRNAGEDIVFEDVSFRYPGAQGEVLKSVSVRIRTGDTIAIVGENGSGKSTLSKLLLGLYNPTEGHILYGKQEIECYTKTGVSAVFQKLHKYKLSLKENVTISEDCNYEEERMASVFRQADLDLLLDSGEISLDTVLDKEFGGTELSGGQWQHIVIGRGIYREHEVIVLDEPTAAIDPLEESRIYEKFADICKEKTAVLVTHRLGAVKLADRILVLRDGQLIEDGTFKELIQKNGYFKEMYDVQKEWYLDKV